MNKFDVIVIGGGPAGLIAAAMAGKRGKSVLLIDKNKLLAKKLRITGKGRCNITNDADMQDFINNVSTNANFLYSAFYSFTNYDVINLFNSLGLETKIERGGRVFPLSDSANDVADALIRYAENNGVRFKTCAARDIIIKEGCIVGLVTHEGEKLESDGVVIATGGVSYPLTGSTGDGYKFASKAGHKIITAKPSLVPLVVKEKWISDLMGLSLKNVKITIKSGEKLIYTDFGEMLFTHFGVSGPIILSASAHTKNTDKQYDLFIDLKPALTEASLDKRVLRDFEIYVNKNFSNTLDDLLPQKLIPIIVKLSGIEPSTKVNQITREQRCTLVNLLKNFPLTITGTRPISEAIITSGGVCVNEINPSTMESKVVKGLYFAGEVIDTDAYTGGFNLQIAFSTGYLAGMNI